MKSPTRSVGTIDDEGILKGSTRNERKKKTIRMTGKKLTEYSTHHGCFAASPRRLRSHSISTAQTRPVTNRRISRNKAKFNRHPAAARRGTPPGEFPRNRPASCASSLLFAFPEACACG